MATATTTIQRTAVPKSTAFTTLKTNDALANPHASDRKQPPLDLPFTVADLRRAIPAHCFEHSLVTSFGYLALDICMALVLYVASTYIETIITPQQFGAFGAFVLRHVCWTAYWFCQGVVFTGLWVIGHECGHGGFASNPLVNDITGFIIHSFLLVPFFSWKISHRRHHANTGSIEHDEVFVPTVISKDEQIKTYKMIELEDHDDYFNQIKSFLSRVVSIIFMLTFGWAAYLTFNTTSNNSYGKNVIVNHFLPSSPIFNDRERVLVLMSDIGMCMMIGLLMYFSSLSSFIYVVYVYIIPYMINVAFLVLITFLQHTSPSLPHFDASVWKWLNGALLTIDRDFGLLNVFLHHITDTHVCHHIFSSMPFYHAQEATHALKRVLAQFYVKDDTPVLKALYDSYKHCYGVVEDADHRGVYWF